VIPNRLLELQERFMVALIQSSETDSSTDFQTRDLNRQQGRGLEIYRNNMRMGLKKTLRETYPVVERLVGETFFSAMAGRYIKQSPSKKASLNEYGEDFPDFIANFPPAATLPYLAEVASLEWIIQAVLLGENHKPFNWQLSEIPDVQQEKLIFHPVKNVQFIYSKYPIDRIWEVNQPEWSEVEEVDLMEGEVFLVLWRQAFDLRIDRFEKEKWLLLKLLTKKIPLGQLPMHPEINEHKIDIVSLLPTLIKEGYIDYYSL